MTQSMLRPPLREACIILPVMHRETTQAFVQYWGGYTRANGVGVWTDTDGNVARELVHLYTIAMEDTAQQRVSLRAVALRYCHQAGQQSVYVRYANGTVEFVSS